MRKKPLIIFMLNLSLLISVFSGLAEEKNVNGLNVVLVSSLIKNAEAIAEAARQNAVAIVYDYENTDLREINLTLIELIEWKRCKIDNLAIICHGASGSLNLGSNYLIDLKKINEEKNEWIFLCTQLTANASIDFYGSGVGFGEDGQKFIKAISLLTAATIHASDDASGNVKNADWDLEVKTGPGAPSSLINFSQLLKTPIYF